jgi:hypothetical protein
MNLYRIYIDEVGNHDLKSADNPNERFLSLTGVIFASDYLKSVVIPELNSIKETVFKPDPDDPIILHRKDILNTRGHFKVLCDVETQRVFNEKLLAALTNWNYIIITVVIDKLQHRDQYKIWRYEPYHYCLKVLLERYVLFLQEVNGRGDALVESRGGKEDRKLKDSYTRLYKEGSEYLSAPVLQQLLTTSQLKVKNKCDNVAGLQICDLIAYPSRKEILSESEFIMKIGSFSGKVINILQNKYLRNRRTGTIWGYGKKMLP